MLILWSKEYFKHFKIDVIHAYIFYISNTVYLCIYASILSISLDFIFSQIFSRLKSILYHVIIFGYVNKD